MPWNIEFLPDQKIIEITNRGILNYNDYKTQTIDAHKLAELHKVHSTLIDDRELINNASEFALFDIPDLYDDLHVNPKAKIAIWITDEKMKDRQYKFFEEICTKRGWQVKLFTDRSSAINWLKS